MSESGYGKPPKSGQFKPGQSGNPKGRPKLNSLRTDLLEELSEQITLTQEDGTVAEISKQRALLKMLMASALMNDRNSIASLLAFMKFCGIGTEDATVAEPPLQPDQLATLKRYMAQAERNNAVSDEQ